MQHRIQRLICLSFPLRLLLPRQRGAPRAGRPLQEGERGGAAPRGAAHGLPGGCWGLGCTAWKAALCCWEAALHLFLSEPGRSAGRSPPLSATAAACLPACHHAWLQNLRGGRVKLGSIMMPEMEFSHPEKGGWAGWVGGRVGGWVSGMTGCQAGHGSMRLATPCTAASFAAVLPRLTAPLPAPPGCPAWLPRTAAGEALYALELLLVIYR